MTFTTIPGAGATDATSFVGTDGVDVLVTFNTLTAFVGAQGSSDRITAGNTSGLVDWQTKGGLGNDTITYQNDVIGGRTNGNGGSDTINVLGNVVGDAAIFGGQNNDTITVVGNVANSRINGNLGADQISGGDLLQASIFGGQQDDTITFAGDLQFSVIGGNLGNDSIFVSAEATGPRSSVIETTLLGGEGDDFINAGGTFDNTLAVPAVVGGVLGSGTGLTIEGGPGTDTIIGSSRNDVIDAGLGGSATQAQQVWGGAGADTMSDGGATIFGYGYNGGNPAAGTLAAAAAESIVRAAGEIAATDVITNWDANDSLLITGVATGAFSGNAGTFETLKQAFAVAGTANTVAIAGIGSAATGYTAYALIYDGTAAAGAIQLGGDNVFTKDNYVNELTAAQIL